MAFKFSRAIDLTILIIIYSSILTSLTNGQECLYEKKCDLGEPDMVNIHIISHTHNDAGWLKTVDQYYTGAKKYIDKAGVQYIIDSVVESLEQNPSRKFSYVEGTFMYRWLTGRSDFDRHRLIRLVQDGQLEILSGGWVMNDEACTHYSDIINQMSLGFKIYKDAFGACGIPRTGWQIDPFGHSAAQATLFAAMGFDGMFFGRVSDDLKTSRMFDHQLEFLWHPLPDFAATYSDRNPKKVGVTDPTFGQVLNKDASDLFVSILPNVYWPPPGFCFDIFCDDEPIQDNPVENGYNKPERTNAFLSEMFRHARNYDTNHLAVTMGNDFNYQSADNWYRNLDKLIRYVNEQRSLNLTSLQFNAFYSTPGCYMYALNNAKKGFGSLKLKREDRRRLGSTAPYGIFPPHFPHGWPQKRAGDFFPLINIGNMLWTGYYSSRPTLKGMIRDSSRFLQICKQIDVLALLEPHRNHDIRQLDRAVALAQHHDAVTGTAKQAVTYDYMERLAFGHEECKVAIEEGLKKLAALKKTERLHFCPLLNISLCDYTQKNSEFDLIVYNPLAWPVRFYVNVPVRKSGLIISDVNGTSIPYQLIPLPNSTIRIPERRILQVGGLDDQPTNPPRDMAVTFGVDLPPLGVARYAVRLSNTIIKGYSNTPSSYGSKPVQAFSKTEIDRNSVDSFNPDAQDGRDPGYWSTDRITETVPEEKSDRFIENEFLRLDFDPVTNLVTKLTNKKSDIKTRLNPWFGYYGVPIDDASPSGAYVFRSNALAPSNLSKYDPDPPHLHFIRGTVLQQARQSFVPWVDLEITLYEGVPALELTWTVGPVPVNDSVPKDIVVRYESEIGSSLLPQFTNHFYTDSNARFVVGRTLSVDPRVRAQDKNYIPRNYYPINSKLFIKDQHPIGTGVVRQLGIVVDRAQGGTSPEAGVLELMVHRRLLSDDNLGVGEALDERGIDGEGLVARGKHWLVFDTPTECDKIMTQMGQAEYLRPQVMFVAPQADPPVIFNKGQFVLNAFPPNLHLLSLAQWDKSILIRLEHIYSPGEDPELSQPVSIDLTQIFATFTVIKIQEMALGANQILSDVKRFQWPVEENNLGSFKHRKTAQDKSNLTTTVTLEPLDIKTFLLKFEGREGIMF